MPGGEPLSAHSLGEALGRYSGRMARRRGPDRWFFDVWSHLYDAPIVQRLAYLSDVAERQLVLPMLLVFRRTTALFVIVSN